jgi:NAD-dependent dihydropyrimidine dehydrogenase PreA subunit
MKRNIISIDEEKCTGCGLCVTGCPEGAIQIIDGKARLVNENFCDGLGACIGDCPEGAITIEKRDAGAYDEKTVIERIASQGEGVIKAHLDHLREHGEDEYYRQALKYLQEEGFDVAGLDPAAPEKKTEPRPVLSCPGSRSRTSGGYRDGADSELTHWPVQMHLINPASPHFADSDLLLAADCTAYTVGDFHRRFLAGKTLAIACPKLDRGKDVYLEKLIALIDHAEINTITVLMMEVPCCGGLVALAQEAVESAKRKVPVKRIVLGIKGDIMEEEWL